MTDDTEQEQSKQSAVGMGPFDYKGSGLIYGYENHSKPENFNEIYFAQPQLKRFVEEMKKRQGSVLDLGSGVGSESNYLKEAIPNGKVFSLDISDYGTRHAKENFDLNQVQADVHTPPFADNTFDGIHSKDVFVHVYDKDNFFKNVSRILKKDGLFVLVSYTVAYEAFKQFSWDQKETLEIARRYGLVLEASDDAKISVEDWYNVPSPRVALSFRKVSEV